MTAEPLATYRLQLRTGGLALDAAAGLLDYLDDLGVSHVYCSPVLTARVGSTHGYDVAEPDEVDPALGGEAALRRLADAAHARGMGLVVDVVPNHLGVGPDNPLWEALLAEGRHGPAGDVFDVDWDHPLPGAADKVVLPVLGAPYGQALAAGELRLAVQQGEPRLRYHEHDLPLRPEDRAEVVAVGDPQAYHGAPGEPATWARLHELLERQHYRLVHWRVGGALVNYRRFFAIDDLAAVRVEDPAVFERTHATVCRLVADGVVDGLRIDHPDGLRAPGRYLERLAERTGGAWTVVEKIREGGEPLPDWPVAGTTGYELAADALTLAVDPAGRTTLDALHRELGGPEPYAEVVDRAKAAWLDGELAADVDRVARRLWRLAQRRPDARDVGWADCREAVTRAVRALEVYRTYVDAETGQARPEDVALVEGAVARAAGALPDGSRAAAPEGLYRLLADALAGRLAADDDARELAARLPQVSAAATAKGVEDTALYRHRRLLAVNEVGVHPERLGGGVAELHRANAERAARHPTGMLTTSTHDTKRDEDVRLRIAALSERAEDWAAAVRRWRGLADAHVAGTRAGPAPDPPTELLLYQTLVGVWPLDGSPPDDALRQRVTDYAVKACREAGERTRWGEPDEAYEDGLAAFVAAVTDPERSPALVADIADVARAAQETAMVTGLAQTLLRATAPGVPDTYQGMELWGDSLVDPDNRRPVDHERRRRLLRQAETAAPEQLWADRRSGAVKLWVLAQALRTRRARPEAFGPAGGYLSLGVEGAWADRLVAYARTGPGDTLGALVVVPRLPTAVAGGAAPLGPAWGDAAVVLPPGAPGRWHDALARSGREAVDGRLPAAALLAALPVALLVPEDR